MTDTLNKHSFAFAQELIKKGDVVVFVYGYPQHEKNPTNTIRRWEVK